MPVSGLKLRWRAWLEEGDALLDKEKEDYDEIVKADATVARILAENKR